MALLREFDGAVRPFTREEERMMMAGAEEGARNYEFVMVFYSLELARSTSQQVRPRASNPSNVLNPSSTIGYLVTRFAVVP